jgi:hypothetical protein
MLAILRQLTRELIRELITEIRRLDRRITATTTEITPAVHASTLTQLHGIGNLLAGKILARPGDSAASAPLRRSPPSTAPPPLRCPPVTSSVTGSPAPGAANSTPACTPVALTQIRHNTPGCAYYQRTRTAGKSHKEALRCLKRQLSTPSTAPDTRRSERLGGLSRQEYRGAWELIVADNTSTDDTAAVAADWAAELPELRVVPAAARLGINHARNVGAATARGISSSSATPMTWPPRAGCAGRSDAHLYRDFRPHGLSPLRAGAGLRSWGRLIRRLPELASHDRIGAWVFDAAWRCGRLMGSLRYGVLCP